jgi:hypothetical protein
MKTRPFMKIQPAWGIIAGLMMAVPHLFGSSPNGPGVKSEMVVTVESSQRSSEIPEVVKPADVTVTQGKTPLHVVSLQPLKGDLADMQLFIFLDDSTRTASLTLHLAELKTFLNSLPSTTQVAVGYMRNGTFSLAQGFTADHQMAADALRPPMAIPGENASPYFALADLVKHWPSKQSTGRRVVLMFTDGVDRYYETHVVDDPYVDAAVEDALKNRVEVSCVYLRGAGEYGLSMRLVNLAQSRLLEIGQETGGQAYFQGLIDPVSIRPFLNDFRDRLERQYKLTFEARDKRGVQEIKVRAELPGVKIEGPSRVYVP